ncbi:MAG: cation diffusion facilitator family transporter [Acidimicrobiia bacterium]
MPALGSKAAPAARDLTRFGWLSIGAALATMGLKFVAWGVTGSVGLLSDAMESTVNLAAAVLMLVALQVAALPPDENHQYGHDKAELFSAAAEGLMIVLAATLIVWSAADRLLRPRPLESLGVGLAVSLVAAAVNGAVALVLLRAGRRHRSRALSADAHHLFTDVVTSAGVLVGVLLVAITGWEPLDALVALAVGVNIVRIGVQVLWQSIGGLMDPPLPPDELQAVQQVLARHERPDVLFHALRSRVSGHRRFVSVHVLVPGSWTVASGHDLLEQLEHDLRAAVAGLTVFTHLEPIEDPVSYDDQRLDRSEPRS